MTPEQRAYGQWQVTQAKQTLRDVNNQRHGYKFKGACNEVEPAQAFSALVAKNLGLDPMPIVRIFRPAVDGEKADFHDARDLKGLQVSGDSFPISDGKMAPVIRILARKSIADFVEVVAHETRHVWQRKHGWDMSGTGAIEADAERYGAWFAKQLGLPWWCSEFTFAKHDPLNVGGMGSASGIFHLNVKTGRLLRGVGYRPAPKWELAHQVDL